MSDIVRCPALRVATVTDHKITETWRCELPSGHMLHHEVNGIRWSFSDGSYHVLAPSHPDYFAAIKEDS